MSPGQKALKEAGDAAFAAAGQPGLVAAYGFNETSGSTVTDASSSNNTGIFDGGVARASNGKFGGALSFDGSGRVTIPNDASLALTNGVTLEAWVNPSAVNSVWRDVVYKGNDNYYLMATSSRSPRPAAGVTRASTYSPVEAFGTSTLPSNTWTHLAMTYDGTAVRLYVNGTQVSSTPASGALLTSTQPLTIGGDPIYGQGFEGLIDEVRVYDRALSANEIKADMNAAISGTTPPPSDTIRPSVTISSPTTQSTYATTSNTLSLSGSARDNVGVTEVTWTNDRGGSGTATGTSSWSVGNIPLQIGVNVMTVSARDAANNVSADTLTVTLSGSSPGPTGLVAAYAFNEASGSSVTDASANGNAGTMGTNVSRTASGKFGGALAFNGGMVTIPNSASLALTSAMTIEAWVNPTSVSSQWTDILNKGRDDYYLMAGYNGGPNPVGAVTFAGNSGSTGAFSNTALTANRWTHLAATYDGAAMHLYLDGREVASFTGADAIRTSTAALTIGGDPYFGQWFRGSIDEVRIYNRALTPSEIASDMATPIGGTTNPPPGDTSAPTVAITSPSSSGSYATTSATVSLGGTASDNVGVTQVSWSNSAGGAGTASGTTSWTAAGIGLQAGTNILTLTARDAAGNASTASISVTYNAPANPTPTALSITTQPSSSATSGQPFARQPVVQLRDASNNAVAKSGVSVTASILSGGGTLGGTTTVTTNASGVATFTNLAITGTAGSRTLSFTSSGLASATSSAISVSTATTPPPGTDEPVFDPSVNTMVYQDNMDGYTSATAMGAAGQSQPLIAPNPSPLTTSSAVQTTENSVIAGRNGTGKALRLSFSGGNQTSATFLTWNMPSTPTLATHQFQYWARVSFSQAFSGVLAVKWFEAWHVHQDRVQWNTHDHLPCTVDGAHATYFQVYDQSRETTCQGNQPVGPWFTDIDDGQWHRFTYQYRPNSRAGARDGFARMWIDGVKIIDISAATIGVTPPGGEKPWCLADDVDNLAVNDGMFNQFWGSTQTTNTPSWTYDIDDYKWWIKP
jgi:hypothetical protein